MSNIELVFSYLKNIYPRNATNHEILVDTGIKPHQQVFQITSKLKARELIISNQINGEWHFQYNQAENENHYRKNNVNTKPLEGTEYSAFENSCRDVFSSFFNKTLNKGKIPNIDKEWDFMSEDQKIVGDAKYYTLIHGVGNPSAKLSTISEHVWLLEKTAAEIKFLVFGNQIEVPQKWLKKYGNLASNIKFYFLNENGAVKELN